MKKEKFIIGVLLYPVLLVIFALIGKIADFPVVGSIFTFSACWLLSLTAYICFALSDKAFKRSVIAMAVYFVVSELSLYAYNRLFYHCFTRTALICYSIESALFILILFAERFGTLKIGVFPRFVIYSATMAMIVAIPAVFVLPFSSNFSQQIITVLKVFAYICVLIHASTAAYYGKKN